MSCENCSKNIPQEDFHDPVPYWAYLQASARAERKDKRHFIIILFLIAALIFSNAFWIYRETQFDTVTTEQTVEQDCTGGDNTFVGGDVIGTTESNN